MIVMFIVVSFIIECVNHSFQNVYFFFNHSFWPCLYEFLPVLPCGR